MLRLRLVPVAAPAPAARSGARVASRKDCVKEGREGEGGRGIERGAPPCTRAERRRAGRVGHAARRGQWCGRRAARGARGGGTMQEQQRTVRAYSEDTERPYFQIRYRLSLSGRELLAAALDAPQSGGGRSARTDSVATTVTTIHEGQALEEEEKGAGQRISRSRSLEAPSDNSTVADLADITSNMPGTPRTNNRKTSHQVSGQQQLNPFFSEHAGEADAEMEAADDIPALRRTRSAGSPAELQMARGAPALPTQDLYLADAHVKGLKEAYPQLVPELRGLITCLNSKNVRKYRVGQAYRKGVVIGIDEPQGKIIVYAKTLPGGTLVVMRSDSVARYEKGYLVQDVQGRQLGCVHAIDYQQGLIVVNTSTNAQQDAAMTAINYY